MSVSSKARQRIDAILDDLSFVEIGADVRARATDFGVSRADTPSDGVITGYGLIESRLVYVYSQDVSVLNGSVGEMHARKIARLYDLALKTGAPVIGLIDSSGMRLQEATDALSALSLIADKQTDASGVIPQISVVCGNCGGSMAILCALTDFVLMEQKDGRFFLNPPDAVSNNYREKCDTSASAFRSAKTPDIDLVCDEASLPGQIRTLMSLLPSNNEDDDSFITADDDLNREVSGIEKNCADPAKALSMIADDALFFETKKAYAPEMATGFLRLNGQTVAVIANRSVLTDEEGKETARYEKRLSAAGCKKAAGMIRFADAFGIPVLVFADAEGFDADMADEMYGASHAASLLYALKDATVPKVTLTTGSAYGLAAIVMMSIGKGADFKVMWPSSVIGTMRAEMAAKILGEGKDADAVREIEAEYKKLQNSASSAAARGVVDEIIDPKDTRKYLIGAFEMLYSKREDRPVKKHGAV